MSRSSPVKRGRGRPPKDTSYTPKDAEIERLLDHIENLQVQLANYRHQEIGWKAVVSYLEDKIGNP